jgi:hypothetical protein
MAIIQGLNVRLFGDYLGEAMTDFEEFIDVIPIIVIGEFGI